MGSHLSKSMGSAYKLCNYNDVRLVLLVSSLFFSFGEGCGPGVEIPEDYFKPVVLPAQHCSVIISKVTYKFKVKAPNDARILLASEANLDDFGYEVLIGGENNMKSCIRNTKEMIKEAYDDSNCWTTQDYLSATQFTQFWITLEKSTCNTKFTISVGKGKLTNEPFMSRELSFTHPIFYYAVAGPKDGVNGFTHKYMFDGKEHSFSSAEYQYMMTSTPFCKPTASSSYILSDKRKRRRK